MISGGGEVVVVTFCCLLIFLRLALNLLPPFKPLLDFPLDIPLDIDLDFDIDLGLEMDMKHVSHVYVLLRAIPLVV